MFVRSIAAIGVLSGIAAGTYKYQTRWIPISEDEIIHAWLTAEMSDPKHQFATGYTEAARNETDRLVLDQPNFDDPKENEVRRNVFNQVRGNYYLWDPIHASTQWYKTRILMPGPKLAFLMPYLPGIRGPYPPANKSEHPPSDLNEIILWGNEKKGPFTILEGNHRWYNRQRRTLMPSVYVGLSSEPYALHDTTRKRWLEWLGAVDE